MPSPAARYYKTTAVRIEMLRKTATDRRLRPMSLEQIQSYYHAALALSVGLWEAYIERVIPDFYDVIANPLDVKFESVRTIALQDARRTIKSFNTPNWENTRNILVNHTGYDPINDWAWNKRGMAVIQTRDRLNEILQVRHSFAHGYPMRPYDWNQSPSGKVRLTSSVLTDIEAFFSHLVDATDNGLKQHIQLTYNVSSFW